MRLRLDVDALEELKTVWAIRSLKARYFRAIDTKDWSAYRAAFADDAVLDVSGEAHDGVSPPLVHGGDAITEFVSGQLTGMTTVHQGHMDEIDVLDSHHATGIWALHDILIWPEGAPIRRLEGYGHYHEQYRREEAGWKIAALRLSRIHVDIET
jgi:hypothetical protein